MRKWKKLSPFHHSYASMSTNYLRGGFSWQKRVKVDSIAEVRVYVRVNHWPTGSVDSEQVHPIHGLQRCFGRTYGTIYTDFYWSCSYCAFASKSTWKSLWWCRNWYREYTHLLYSASTKFVDADVQPVRGTSLNICTWSINTAVTHGRGQIDVFFEHNALFIAHR